jgi:hypothetical protein
MPRSRRGSLSTSCATPGHRSRSWRACRSWWWPRISGTPTRGGRKALRTSGASKIDRLLDVAYPTSTAIKLILDNHSAHISKETRSWLAQVGGAASGKSGGSLALDWCQGSSLDRLGRRSFALHARLSSDLGDPWGYRRLTTYSGYAAFDDSARGKGGRPWLSAGVTIMGQLGSAESTAAVEPRTFSTGLMRAAQVRGAMRRRLCIRRMQRSALPIASRPRPLLASARISALASANLAALQSIYADENYPPEWQLGVLKARDLLDKAPNLQTFLQQYQRIAMRDSNRPLKAD